MGLNPSTAVLNDKRDHYTQKEGGQVQTEAEIGSYAAIGQGMQRISSTCQQVEETGRSLPWRLDSASNLQTCENIHFCCFKPPSLW